LQLNVSFKGRMLGLSNAVNTPQRLNDISHAVDAPRVATLTVFVLAGNPTNTLWVPPEGLVFVVSNIIRGGPGFENIYVHN
jgi:hypothetical protein